MNAIDLFAGCGGASVGMTRAGVDVVAEYERDTDACDTLRAWHRSCGGVDPFGWIVNEEDLADMPASYLPNVDMWWASPPCQPDSSAGKRGGSDDARDGWPHLFRLFRLLRDREATTPRWLVCETVRGILPPKRIKTDKHRARAERWRNILSELAEHFAVVEYRVLDAADYGVPQHRRRVIIVCGPRAIDWPVPTHGPERPVPWVSMGEALGLGPGGRVIGGGHNPSHPGDVRRYNDLTGRPSTTIAAQHGGGAGNAGPFVLNSQLPQSRRVSDPSKPSPTLTAGSPTSHHAPYVPTPTERPPWWHRASPPDGPSRTIGTKANASVMLKAGTGRRRLTIEECLILQDLAGHPVQGKTKASRYRQAGNAVPPRLAEVIARSVIAVDV